MNVLNFGSSEEISRESEGTRAGGAGNNFNLFNMFVGRIVMPTATASAPFDRQQMAERYARRHFTTDAGVMKIYYLPTNAPPREIRLLEVNKLIAEMSPAEPVDFGVDIDGAGAHTLFVLDVTPAQWAAVQRGELSLPAGWTLDGHQAFPAPEAA